jgi:hypothetical protein
MRFSPTTIIHTGLAITWIACALLLGLRLALLGVEEQVLDHKRGQERKAQIELESKAGRLRADIVQQTSPTALAEAAHQIDPTLAPPFRPSSTQSPVAMTIPYGH